MNLNNNSSYMAMMPSPVTAVMAKSPVAMALPSQIVDSTITSEKQQQHESHQQQQQQQQQQQLQTAAKYLTSVKSSPQSPSSSPQSPQPPSLLHQTSSLVPSVTASLTISSSATTLSSAGGYHSNLISRISSNSMNSSSNNSTVKDKVQISCNLSQDMEATGSKNNNNLSNETSVNLNLTHNNNNNNNNNLSLIANNTSMHTHRSSSSIMNDATASSLQMSSLLDDSCCPSKMGTSPSPLNFLRFPTAVGSIGGSGYGTAAEVNNAVVNCLNSGENALNLSNIGKNNSDMTVTATPLISSSGIVQSRMTNLTGMSTSLRNDEGSDLMRRGNFGRN